MNMIAQPGAVDVHVHVTPALLLRGPGREDRWRPSVFRDESGRQVRVELGGRPMSSIVAELSQTDTILALVGNRGVRQLVISPWVSTLPVSMDPGAAADVCRAQNQAMLAAARRHPGRVAVLGSVPLQDAEAAAGMLTELMRAGMAGVEITPCTGGRWLGDPALEPFWAAAEELGAVVFVHPASHGLGLDVLGEYYLWNAVGNPAETAAAAAHMIMAGVLERHERLVMVLAHGGGVLPTLAGRLDRAFAVRAESRRNLGSAPSVSMRRLRFDTVTHDPAALAALADRFGADHLLLGSDHPFDMGSDDPVSDVRNLGLAQAQEEMVLWRNAHEIFAGLTGPA